MMRIANTERADRLFAELQRVRGDFERLEGDLAAALVGARAIYHRMEEIDGGYWDLASELRRRDRTGKYAGLERRLLKPAHGELFPHCGIPAND